MRPDCSTREIPLTKGRVALVDADDYEMVSSFSWSMDGRGHVKAYVGSGRGREKYTALHRLIMLPDPGAEIDHVNGNKLDNRRCNLRHCTSSQNNMNSRAWSTNPTGYKGVYLHEGGKWCARIKLHRKSRHLGLYMTAEEAARAYNIAALELFGEFARLNDVEKEVAA